MPTNRFDISELLANLIRSSAHWAHNVNIDESRVRNSERYPTAGGRQFLTNGELSNPNPFRSASSYGSGPGPLTKDVVHTLISCDLSKQRHLIVPNCWKLIFHNIFHN